MKRPDPFDSLTLLILCDPFDSLLYKELKSAFDSVGGAKANPAVVADALKAKLIFLG